MLLIVVHKGYISIRAFLFPESQRRRGVTTMVELLLASALTLMLGLASSVSLSVASRAARSSVIQATTSTQIRDLNQNMVRFLRGAKPKGACTEPAAGIPRQACTSIIEDPNGPFISATSDTITFYAYTTNLSNIVAVDKVTAPDKVTVEVTTFTDGTSSFPGREIKLSKVPPDSGTTYTNAQYNNGPSEQLRQLVLQMPANSEPTTSSPATAFFQFYDNSGTEICVATDCTASELKAIAMVAANTKVWVQTDRNIWNSFGFKLFIAIPSRGFQD